MIPSVFIQSGTEKFIVVYNHTWQAKLNRIGRRIPHQAISVGWVGVTVFRQDEPEIKRTFAPMTAREAVRLFVENT